MKTKIPDKARPAGGDNSLLDRSNRQLRELIQLVGEAA